MALNDKQLAWFIRHYKHTKNAEICAKLGISTSYLHILARRHGLKKSKQFMLECQAAAVVAAKIAIENEDSDAKALRAENARKNSEKGRFKKCEWALANKTETELAAINAKRAESWRKTRHDDEVMLNWYGEQKTNFRFARHKDPKKNRRLMSIRNYFKRRGYVFTQRAGMCAFYTEDTKRSKKVEDEAKKLGMLIKESQ